MVLAACAADRLGIRLITSTPLSESDQVPTNKAAGISSELHVTSRIPVAFCLGSSRLPESLARRIHFEAELCGCLALILFDLKGFLVKFPTEEERREKRRLSLFLHPITMADKQRDWRREENDEDDEGEQELDETVSRRGSHLA